MIIKNKYFYYVLYKKCFLYFILSLILLKCIVYCETISDRCPEKCACLGGYVDCSKKNLSSVPIIPQWTDNLELSSNKLRVDDIKDSIRNLPKLTKLNIENNDLERIPQFSYLPSIKSLSLAYNQIQLFNRTSLQNLVNLKILDLKNNNLKILLQNSFAPKNHLTKLFLNGNQINIINDAAFKNLTQLQELRLGINKLLEVPKEALKYLYNLKKLELNNNEIYELNSFSFQNLNKLKILKLRKNKIEKIFSDTFYGLNNLNNLDLSANDLITIDTDYFKNLSNLKELNLDGNKITYIYDGAFNHTPNLAILNLNNNRLTMNDDNIPKFIALKQLNELSLNSNQIKIIQLNVFYGLSNIKRLDLGNNNITTIQAEAFRLMAGLTELDISSSNLICDCNMGRLHNWMRSINRDLFGITAVCDNPPWLNGKKLKDLVNDNFTCHDYLRPKIIEEPKSQIAIRGGNLTLNCIVQSASSSEISISWKQDNIELDPSYYIISYNKSDDLNSTQIISTLDLKNMRNEYAGKYQCGAANDYGSVYSNKVKITVAAYPVFTKVPSNVTLESGNTARLDCAAVGDPQPQIAWHKDGGDFPAARERRMHVMPQDDAFYIINAKINDQGIYTCTAENSVGIITANATLTVDEPPSFVKLMENKEVTTGKSVVLECMASGSPQPELRWLKDNRTIDTTERHFFAAENQLLIIVDVNFADAGNYCCEISNKLGNNSGNINLTVNPLIVSHIFNFKDMLGVVIITVFCCAVVTSIVWVIIIYQARKRSFNYNNNLNTNNNINVPTELHYECARINETSFGENKIDANQIYPKIQYICQPPVNKSPNLDDSCDVDDENENNPLNTNQSDNIKITPLLKASASSSSIIATLSSPVQTSNEIADLKNTNNDDIETSCDSNVQVNINGINYTKMNPNFQIENKLNRLDNFMNCSNNSGATNNAILCLPGSGSLDSVHSIKQSL